MQKLTRFFDKVFYITNPFYWLTKVYSWLNSNRFSACGAGFYSAYPLKVVNAKRIRIGRRFSAMGNDYLYADSGKLIIGDNCSINTNVIIGASGGEIVIGDNVMIAPNVVIRASNHGIVRGDVMRFQKHTRGVIVIEDDVWIGSNAVITADVVLAQGTVVGAGAVVTKSTEPYSIVGGIPARKIGERI